jgi:hypothetical protein
VHFTFKLGHFGDTVIKSQPGVLFRFTFGNSITFRDSITTLPYCLCLIIYTLLLLFPPRDGFYGVDQDTALEMGILAMLAFPLHDIVWWSYNCFHIGKVVGSSLYTHCIGSLLLFACYRLHIANEQLFKIGFVLSLYIWGPSHGNDYGIQVVMILQYKTHRETPVPSFIQRDDNHFQKARCLSCQCGKRDILWTNNSQTRHNVPTGDYYLGQRRV